MPRFTYAQMRRRARRARRARGNARIRRMRGRKGTPSQPVHYFTRSQFATSAVTVSSTGPQFFASSFALNNLADITDFTNLYDQYKILKIKYTIMPKGNASDVGIAAGIGNMARVCSVLDYDDSVAPTSFNQLVQYNNIKWTHSTQNHTRTFVPKFTREVATGLGTTASEIATGWINCANTTVAHRGIKVGIQNPQNGVCDYDLVVKYYLAFKGVR